MKKYFYLFLTFSTLLMADSYLFADTKIKSGGYGGPSLKFAQINGETSIIYGGGGAWVINDAVSLGLTGFSQGYGGIKLGYNFSTDSSINPYIAITANYRAIIEGYSASPEDKSKNQKARNDAELELGIQLKMTKWFRIEPYIGYATVSSIDNNDHLTYGLNFSFGKWNK